MKLKKLILLGATLAIAASMATLPVKADVNYTWHMDESAANSDANSGPALTDFAGKGSGYTYAFTGAKTHVWLTSSFADASKCLQIPADYTNYEGYMLISMNVYSPEGQQFQFQVTDSYPITPNVTVTTANGFNINRWNKVFAVVKLSATRSNRTGYYYINGEKKSWKSDGHYLFNDTTTFNTIRLRTQKDNTPLYVDDLNVAFTTDALTTSELDALAAMPTLTAPLGETATVGGVDKVTGTVNVPAGTTLAGLQSMNTNTLTAYTDSTFTTPLASTDSIADGNVIIATDPLGQMSYFNVDGSWWEMNISDASGGENSAKAENNFAGKGSGYTYGFTGAATYFRFTNSFGNSNNCLKIPVNYTSYEGYMLISMNVYSPNGQQFQFQAADAKPITPNVTVTTANGFNINRWNKVFAVVKLSATQSNRTGYYYINGEKKSWTSNSHYLFNDSSYTTVRLKTQKNNTALYIDDVHIAFVPGTLTDAQLEELAAMPTLENIPETYIQGNTVNVIDAATLSDLQAGNTNTLTAYTDSTFATPLTSNAELANGNVVIATDSFGKMSYFDVVDNKPYVKENGTKISNYTTGTMTFGRKLYIEGTKDLAIFAAQFNSSDHRFINSEYSTGTYSGFVDLSQDLGITASSGTEVYLMIWEANNGGYRPVCSKTIYLP